MYFNRNSLCEKCKLALTCNLNMDYECIEAYNYMKKHFNNHKLAEIKIAKNLLEKAVKSYNCENIGCSVCTIKKICEFLNNY